MQLLNHPDRRACACACRNILVRRIDGEVVAWPIILLVDGTSSDTEVIYCDIDPDHLLFEPQLRLEGSCDHYSIDPLFSISIVQRIAVET